MDRGQESEQQGTTCMRPLLASGGRLVLKEGLRNSGRACAKAPFIGSSQQREVGAGEGGLTIGRSAQDTSSGPRKGWMES